MAVSAVRLSALLAVAQDAASKTLKDLNADLMRKEEGCEKEKNELKNILSHL